ncbi:MAG: hypothetical protein M3O23_11870 [Actinomycetota bacterium]|nr:hypothetical protein [Actinomycetota bacterium]
MRRARRPGAAGGRGAERFPPRPAPPTLFMAAGTRVLRTSPAAAGGGPLPRRPATHSLRRCDRPLLTAAGGQGSLG